MGEYGQNPVGDRVKQAIILAGGKGERLRPLTDNLPKPLIPVNGHPFISYLLAQFWDQGIERVVILTGYKGEMIQAAIKDGYRYGPKVTYSHGPVEWETGRRIYEADSLLDERFLLLYADTYLPFSLTRLERFHKERCAAISLMLTPKSPGNVILGDDGLITYSPDRSAAMHYVEAGYMLVDRDRIITGADESFNETLRFLGSTRQLAGLVSRDRYLTISNIERLAETRKALRETIHDVPRGYHDDAAPIELQRRRHGHFSVL